MLDDKEKEIKDVENGDNVTDNNAVESEENVSFENAVENTTDSFDNLTNSTENSAFSTDNESNVESSVPEENNTFDNNSQSNSYNNAGNNNSQSNSYNNAGNDNSQSNAYNNAGNVYTGNNTGNNGGYNNSQNDYTPYYKSAVPQGNPNNNPNKSSNTKGVVAIVIGVVAGVLILVGGLIVVSQSALNEYRNKSFVSENETKKEKKEYKKIEDTKTTDSNAQASDGKVLITDVSDVVDEVMPSIVAITSTTIVESSGSSIEDWLYGMYGYGSNNDQKQQYEQVGAGSGIIVKQNDDELLIVTNNHVVQGADKLSIQFVNGKSIEAVTKSTDENADIAIVSVPLEDIDSETMDAIKIAQLGDSDALKVGDGVIAIGNALGYGQSVTTGVISARDREIQVDDRKMVVLQTDAAINGGNSGGALLDSTGKVIGINVAKYSSSEYSGSASIEGMGFAIPISQATDIMENLMSRQTRTKVDEKERGVLGIEGLDVQKETAESYGIPVGIYVKNVISGGGAAKAGMKEKDIIVEIDGMTVESMESLQEKLLYYKAGEEVVVKVKRIEGAEYVDKELKVTLSKSSLISKDSDKNLPDIETNPFGD